MKIFRNVSRILVGLVFIFSGFVKGIDPLGMCYRLEDYFQAFGIPWAVPFALYLSIFLCTLEFIIGISLLFNLWIKGSAWALLGMMIFFICLTFFDAVYNLVPDCGCFGDAIKLTNPQTFLKNIILMIFVIPVFAGRKNFKDWAPGWAQKMFLLIFSLSFLGVSIYSYRHLPIIDFMGWRVGSKINLPATPLKFFVTYKNKVTGEEKEYLTPDYPWNDSVWISQWVFKSQRAVDPAKGQALALRVEDERGADVSSSIVDNPDLQFILVAYDLGKTDTVAFHRILPFYKKATNEGYSFICLTSSLQGDIKKFRMDNGTAFSFYNVDDVVLKTMVRSNPGLIVIRNGIVLAKWPFRNFPSYESVMEKFRNP
ncbi:MAG TPA: BT_3928 family protein [Bacteroidales bacterium]|nr:BT_3928 family protein [Bacteroidales bacterium]